MSKSLYKSLRQYVIKIIDENKGREQLSIDLAPSLWVHIDINPFQIASELNKYLIQMGVYERGQLLVKVSAAPSMLTLTFPLTVSEDGRDDPDRIDCFD